jgi:hypothetical protein
MINFKRVHGRIQAGNPAGLESPEAFLAAVEPELRAIVAEIATMDRMFDETPDTIRQFPCIAAGLIWFRLREHDHSRMAVKTAAALRQLARHRAILEAALQGHRTTRRRVRSREQELLARLEAARETMQDFVTAIDRWKPWSSDVPPTLLPELRNGIGCLVKDATPY